MKAADRVRVAVMINIRSILLGVLAVGGLSAAAVAFEHKAPPPVEVACLAVAPGVCLSGTVSWVAHAAAMSDRPAAAVMMAMAGDDY